jgi:hypothetical protein
MPVKQTMKQDYSGSDRHGNIKKQKNHGGVSLASKSIRIYWELETEKPSVSIAGTRLFLI